jgi:hypothetical protein
MGTYRSPGIIKNTVAGALAKTTEEIGKSAADYISSVENQKKLQRLQDNKANEDLYGLSKSINDIPTADDKKFDEEFKGMLKSRMDELYLEGRKVARGGDNTEYLRLKAETESLAASIPNLIESINYNANMLDKGLGEGKRLLATTDGKFGEFLQNWNNEGGSKVVPRIQNGKLILDYNGYIVNTDAVLKSVEKGGGINFVEDPMKELEQVFKVAGGADYELYSQLKTTTRQQGSKIIKDKLKDFTVANKRIRQYFDVTNITPGSTDDPLASELNQNNYQFFVGPGVFDINNPKQRNNLRKAMVDRMMKDFAYDDVINKGTAQTTASKSDTDTKIIEAGTSKALNLLNKQTKQVVELVAPIKNENSKKALIKKFNIPEDKFDSSNSQEYLAMRQLLENVRARTRTQPFEIKYDEGSNIFKIYQKEDGEQIYVNVKDENDVRNFINSVTPDKDENKVDLSKTSGVKFN